MLRRALISAVLTAAVLITIGHDIENTPTLMDSKDRLPNSKSSEQAGTRAAAGATASSTPAVPVGAQEYFVSDFRNGFTDWGNCQTSVLNGDCSKLDPKHRGIQLVDRPDAAQGHRVARFTVQDGDTSEVGGERAELSDDNAGATVREGDERWYQWSMRLADDFPEPRGDWFIVMQWHSSSGSPPLAIDLANGKVDIGGDGSHAERQSLGPLRRGEWVDYILHVRFSKNADSGFVEGWENGVQTVSKFKRTTMSDQENYLKQGIYRDADDRGTATIDFDRLRITGPPDQGEVQPRLKKKKGLLG